MSINEYLKQLRIEKGLSQRQLAEQSKLNNAEISRIESGDRQPTHATLAALSPALGVQYEDLLIKAGYVLFNNYWSELKYLAFFKQYLLDKWTVELHDKNKGLGDIIARKKNDKDDSWIIEYWYFTQNYNEDKIRELKLRVLEYLFPDDKSTKSENMPSVHRITLAVNNEDAFERLSQVPFGQLKTKIDVMLVDLQDNKITKEAVLN